MQARSDMGLTVGAVAIFNTSLIGCGGDFVVGAK
jgi:hypothetical protein